MKNYFKNLLSKRTRINTVRNNEMVESARKEAQFAALLAENQSLTQQVKDLQEAQTIQYDN